MSREPSLAEVVRDALEYRLSRVHVCMPARVESYDAAAQTCTATPTVKNLLAVDGGTIEDTYPTIPDVPVAFPRWGSWFMHAPLAAGDHVVLVFGERSLDRWRQLGGVQSPGLTRMHDLSDAIALPASLYPDASALASPPAHLVLGKQGGSTIHVKEDGTVALGSENPADAAATANKVSEQLLALKVALDAALVGDEGAALRAALTALFVTGWPASTASTKVKVDP